MSLGVNFKLFYNIQKILLTARANTYIIKLEVKRLKYNELKKLLKKNGCFLERQGKNHEIWFSPKTGCFFTVGRHGTEEVAAGTLKSIKKDAGIE